MMKRFYFLSLALLTTACASHPVASNSPQVAPDLAGAKDSAGTFSAKLPAAMYQGPFELNPENAGRKAALAYLPLQYSEQEAWPLVILLHGFTGTAKGEDTYLGLRYRTSLKGFVLLTPEGTVTPTGTIGDEGRDLSGNQFWNATESCCDFAKTGVDDSGYILRLIEKAKQTYKIDPSRIYLFGHSNGGFMVNRLGCDAGGSFAGIANLAGGSFKDLKSCKRPEAVPYLHIHAPNDKTILFEGTPEYAGARETVNQWLNKNGCQDRPVQGWQKDFVLPISGVDTKETSWKNCTSGKGVSLWTIQSFEGSWHNPHVPLFNFSFTDAVLDFLFQHRNSNSR